MKHVTHYELKMEAYLSSPVIYNFQTKYLFHVRCWMLFLRSNYSHMYKDDYCPLCSGSNINVPQFIDTQEHLLTCDKLSTESEVIETGSTYTDIFSKDVEKQAKLTLLLSTKYNRRTQLEKEIISNNQG